MKSSIVITALCLTAFLSCEKVGINNAPVPCDEQYKRDIIKITQDSTRLQLSHKEADSLRQIAYEAAIRCAYGK